MAQVILQLVIDMPEVNDGEPQEIEQDIQYILNGDTEEPSNMRNEYGITGITVVFEDVV